MHLPGNRAIVTVLAFICLVAAVQPANAIKMIHNTGGYSIELKLLNAEAFGTGMPGMSQGHRGMVMVATGGANAVQVDDPSHPNHHLVIDVHDAASHKIVTNADVSISFTLVDASGKPVGPATRIPIVIMQASDKGVASTHYGNNVTMPSGSYLIDVTVNGVNTTFRLKT